MKKSIDLIKQKILPDYEKVLVKIRGMNYEDIKSYLKLINMYDGICFYASEQYEAIPNEVFKSYIGKGVYVDGIPLFCTSKNQIIEAFETRIRVMREIANEQNEEE